MVTNLVVGLAVCLLVGLLGEGLVVGGLVGTGFEGRVLVDMVASVNETTGFLVLVNNESLGGAVVGAIFFVVLVAACGVAQCNK